MIPNDNIQLFSFSFLDSPRLPPDLPSKTQRHCQARLQCSDLREIILKFYFQCRHYKHKSTVFVFGGKTEVGKKIEKGYFYKKSDLEWKEIGITFAHSRTYATCLSAEGCRFW